MQWSPIFWICNLQVPWTAITFPSALMSSIIFVVSGIISMLCFFTNFASTQSIDACQVKISYDPNAEVRTRYRSDVYSEQCVQSKHREITNSYINITVAFIAYSISDLVFLEGQSLYTNSHPLLCSVFFSSLELGRH